MSAHVHHMTKTTPAAASSSPAKTTEKWDKDRTITLIGRIASVLSVVMYMSYITQIANNLGGHPGTPWQPLAAFFNCVMWSIYGWAKPQRDWPIVIANVPGIFLAAITFITSFI